MVEDIRQVIQDLLRPNCGRFLRREATVRADAAEWKLSGDSSRDRRQWLKDATVQDFAREFQASV